MTITDKMLATQAAYKKAKKALEVAQKAFDKADNLLHVDDPKLLKARQKLDAAMSIKDMAFDTYSAAWEE